MALFKNAPQEWQRLDWAILQNGWTSLYYRNKVLSKDLSWFSKENYTIIEFDCGNWSNEKDMHNRLKLGLDFPDYYGNNFDALNDCLSDLDITKFGLVIVFRRLNSMNNERMHLLVDTFADNARRQMLFGKRMIILMQVDDPNFQMQNVGGTPVTWNDSEWMDSNRI